MRLIDRLTTLLDGWECPYQHDIHPLAYTARETAHAEHVSERSFAKVVVLHSETGFLMAVLPANARVDLEEIREAFGSRHLRLATERELNELFPECDLGAMPPFGNGTLFEIPVYVDSSMGGPEIFFNAGTHRDVVQMSMRDWMRIVRPVAIDFARYVAVP
jgi:Ala-tRNA(Pro) deacylase